MTERDIISIKNAIEKGEASLSSIKKEYERFGTRFVSSRDGSTVITEDFEIVQTFDNGEFYKVIRDEDGDITDFDHFYLELLDEDSFTLTGSYEEDMDTIKSLTDETSWEDDLGITWMKEVLLECYSNAVDAAVFVGKYTRVS